MRELTLLENPQILFQKKIVIYGASGGGKNLLTLLEKTGIKVEAFCDSNSEKVGTRCCNIPVIGIDTLKEWNEEEELCILIGSQYVKEIVAGLEEKGISTKFVFWGYSFSFNLAIRYAVFQNPTHMPELHERLKLQKEVFDLQGKDTSYEYDNSMNKMRLMQMLESEKDMVLAFQPPKVGSTTIFQSLDWEQCFTMHFHDLEMFF